MAKIMCAQSLWRVVRHWTLADASSNPSVDHLGSWAATRFREEENDLLMAINESTYLTVVVTLGSEGKFLAEFRAAVTADYRISEFLTLESRRSSAPSTACI